jgi:hypothetical protein
MPSPCGVWKLTSVPADKVDEVVAGYQLQNPISVNKTANADGTFDVVATFPACADNSATNQPAGGTTYPPSC